MATLPNDYDHNNDHANERWVHLANFTWRSILIYAVCALVRSFRPGLALPCPAMPHDKITSPSIPDFLHLRTGEGDLRICCKQQKYGKIIKDDLILNGRGSIKFLHNREAGQITFLWNHQSQTLIVWEKLKSNWLNFTRRALATRWKKQVKIVRISILEGKTLTKSFLRFLSVTFHTQPYNFMVPWTLHDIKFSNHRCWCLCSFFFPVGLLWIAMYGLR